MLCLIVLERKLDKLPSRNILQIINRQPHTEQNNLTQFGGSSTATVLGEIVQLLQ